MGNFCIAATEDDELDADLREKFEQAQQADVSGIPTFVYEGHAARGRFRPNSSGGSSMVRK